MLASWAATAENSAQDNGHDPYNRQHLTHIGEIE